MSLVQHVPAMVVTDMDGTLLDHTSQVSRRNADALRRAHEGGARVVIATGRPLHFLDPLLEIGFDGIAVCANGAVVYDIAAGQILSSAVLQVPPMREFIDELHLVEPDFAIAVERVGMGLDVFIAEPHYEHPWGGEVYLRQDRETLLAEPVARLTVSQGNDSAALAHHARRAAGARVAVTYSTDAGLIEVSAPGVNKGTALARLAAGWGIDPADVIAFGDMPNDLEMLTWAGHGVAMGNGHDEVLAVANEIVGLHHDDAVAQVLERWF